MTRPNIAFQNDGPMGEVDLMGLWQTAKYLGGADFANFCFVRACEIGRAGQVLYSTSVLRRLFDHGDAPQVFEGNGAEWSGVTEFERPDAAWISEMHFSVAEEYRPAPRKKRGTSGLAVVAKYMGIGTKELRARMRKTA